MRSSEEEKKESPKNEEVEVLEGQQEQENKADAEPETPPKCKFRINAEWAKSTLFIFSTIYWVLE